MTSKKRRMGTVFGWLAGGSLGLIVNYAVFLAWGEGYPIVPTTFGLFVVGCFGGMWLADRLGDRSFRILGVAAGVLLSVALAFAVMLVMAYRR